MLAPFSLIQYFPKKTSFFLKFLYKWITCRFLSLSVSMLLLLGRFFGWEAEKERGGTFHVLAFFSNASNIAVHLFVWYDLCFIWRTYEWENENPCDRRLWIPHTILMHAIYIQNGQTFFWLVKSRMNFMAFFSVCCVTIRTCAMCCFFGIIVCIKIERSCERTHTDTQWEKERDKNTHLW